MALTRGVSKFLPPGKCEAVVFAPFATAPPAARAPPLRPQGAPPVAEVSAEALEQLEAMGFEPDRARAALANAGNDLQRALHALLS
ncbi:hypothetical protein H632_c7p1 [Helicosporidium sp. ATCC 50920]|nr:hypothetical protein H632_c7p1 [Helicosporidium sp. ATCC 50920]|eukprot:KDD77153.1 hypothetical protein H632_c7p1 [Helicosporidium sp. ATCC 50920]